MVVLRFDKVENVVAAEVRKVREVLRKGISNDTQDLAKELMQFPIQLLQSLSHSVLFLLG